MLYSPWPWRISNLVKRWAFLGQANTFFGQCSQPGFSTGWERGGPAASGAVRVIF